MAVSGSIWSTVVGHDGLLERLEREAARGRAAPATLFAGPPGVGKLTVGLGLAQRLHCTGDPAPCGRCAGCLGVARRVPGQVLLLEPEEQGGTAVVKQRVHKIDSIRRLQAEAALRALGDRPRVCLIRSAELMTEPAANCLLKVLEEPPPGLALVLTSEQPAALLPTILSRLRRYDLGEVPAESMARWLVAQHGCDPATAETAAWAAAGRPARALALATDPAARAVRDQAHRLLAALRDRPPVAALAAAQALLGEEADAARLESALDALEGWYRDALVLQADAGPIRQRDRQEEIARFAAQWQPAELRAGLDALLQARISLRRNGNVALVLEVMWLRLARGGRPAGLARLKER